MNALAVCSVDLYVSTGVSTFEDFLLTVSI